MLFRSPRERATRPGGARPGIHEDETFDSVGMARREPQPDRPAPIVQDQRHLVEIQMQQQGFEVRDVVAKPIRIWVSRDPGFAHPHVVRHDAATTL